MKVFISLPMHGKTGAEITANLEKATGLIQQQFDDCEIIHNYLVEPAPKEAGRLWYLGRAVQTMDGVDAVVFMPGWKKASGCLIEYEVARLYNIPRLCPQKENGVRLLKQF